MQREEPSKMAIPISIPSTSPPEVADKDDRTSGAPPPKARRVTPARLSDRLNVFEISSSEGQRNSSAV